MIVHRQGELVESNATVACLLAAQIDEFLIPSIKDAVDFDVQHLPPQLTGMVSPITDVFLPLLQVPQQLLAQVILLPHLLDFSEDWRDDWCNQICFLAERTDGLVAHVLTDDELVLSDLFIGVVILVLFGEVYSHATEELARQGRDLLVELCVEDLD
jgi:hypothetical protein